MFAFILVFFTWLPPMLQGFCLSLFSVFLLYATIRLLKLLWDILPMV